MAISEITIIGFAGAGGTQFSQIYRSEPDKNQFAQIFPAMDATSEPVCFFRKIYEMWISSNILKQELSQLFGEESVRNAGGDYGHCECWITLDVSLISERSSGRSINYERLQDIDPVYDAILGAACKWPGFSRQGVAVLVRPLSPSRGTIEIENGDISLKHLPTS